MGLPHGQKERTEMHKIPTKKCMAIRTLSEHSVRMAIHFFVNLTFSNGCILLTIRSIYTKLGDFVKLGLHFMTMWINSC